MCQQHLFIPRCQKNHIDLHRVARLLLFEVVLLPVAEIMELFYQMMAAAAVAFPFFEGTYDLSTNNSMFSSRIFNGADAEPHSISYQVFLTTFARKRMSYCGGSLISTKHVLTAAHCLNRKHWALLLFGVDNIFKANKNAVGRRVERSEMLIHPGFNEKLGVHDIAVMYLIFPVTLSENLQAVNLPRLSQIYQSFSGREVEASGWGRLSDMRNSKPANLQFAKLRVMPLKYCQKFYNFPLRTSVVCALGKSGENTCSGDSGGPLTFQDDDGSKTILGITSFGSVRGCDVNIPGVFTRVSSYLMWIWKTTGIHIRE